MELTATTILKSLEQKWRFPSKRGVLSLEDLFDLPLTKNNGVNLDAVAIEINNQLQEKTRLNKFCSINNRKHS